MADTKLTSDIIEILDRSTITENSVILPPGNLDRKTYVVVNRALEAAGGQWNRKTKSHIFDGNPRVKLGLIKDAGIVVDEKKKFQAFFTPADLAETIADLADVDGHTVFEPSAGEGALVDACMEAGALGVECVELNPESVGELRKRGYPVREGDFIALKPDEKYSRIVMNPPFTKNQDIKHVAHALKFLAPNGILVAVMSPNTSRPKFEALIEGLDYSIQDVPKDTFKESGTSIATIILTIRN